MAGYGSDEAFSAWLAASGYTLPEGSPSAAVLRQRGSTYIDATYGMRFPGTPTGGAAQERAWPRTGATDRWGNALDPNTVPTRVVEASFEAAWVEASSPGSLSASGSTAARVKREKVEGAVEVEYQSTFGSKTLNDDLTPIITTVEGLLAPLLGATNVPYPLVV
jgi:hypothetical protein